MHFQGENYTYFYLTYLNDYLWNIYPYLNECSKISAMKHECLSSQHQIGHRALDLSGAANVEDNGTRRKNFVSALVSGAIIYPGLVL